MQIVIDIPEEVGISNIVNEINCLLTDYFNGTYCKITPLPKGHGRLIDAGNFINVLNNEQIEGLNTYKGFGRTKELLIEAPTIIEADKKSEERYEG